MHITSIPLLLPDLSVMADRELPPQGKEIKMILKVTQIEKDKHCVMSLACGVLRKTYN